MRFGSVVSRIDLPATERSCGEDHHAWCLCQTKIFCETEVPPALP